MLNKNDPLIGAVQEVMRKNQADRDAVKAVNEKFGVVDRRALPHEQQAHWDAAYKAVITEGVEALDEMSEKQKKLAKVGNEAGLGGSPTKIDGPDLEGARKGHAKHIEEAGMIPPKGSVKRMIVKAKAGIKAIKTNRDAKDAEKYFPSRANPIDRDINKMERKRADTAKKVYNRLEEDQLDEVLDTDEKKMNYAKKASDQIKSHMERGGAYDMSAKGEKDAKRVERRTKGLQSLVRKIQKKTVNEDQLDEVLDTSKKRMDYGIKAIGSYVKASLTGDKNTKRKRLAGNKNYKKKVAQAGEKQAMDSYREKKSGEVLRDMGRKTGLGQHYDKIFKEEHLEEKAVSKAQHRFFGLVRGIQKGEAKGSAEATKAAKSMSVKSVRDYAKTKEKGLPEKKD